MSTIIHATSNKGKHTLIHSLMKLFTILLLLSCFISCSLRPKKSIDDRINEAIELQKNKHPEKAMAIYYQVLPEVEDLSKRSVIYYNLGAMYLWDRIFDKAYDMFHQPISATLF
ncbi:hypothetical protein DXA68_01720 [Bacteroides stercorirosoris]|uniref:Tetratricopeptide repeat protein n=2 Tax=Bacteroides stercorirosoris TaxID=871324 RepID=A0A413HCG9_9BACE|nr:hypothetical protein DXA68_01720 [Bacteroides stercorirosoris]